VAANVTAFNTVVSYDLWQAYVRKDEPDRYYVRFGRVATVLGIIIAIGTAAHAPGVGIGLSVVARFAELHGGRAWVQDRPGGGASFQVLLPDAADPADVAGRA
jgi:light-regulated signal transduction histidine kinase (bacteriophytochrome)